MWYLKDMRCKLEKAAYEEMEHNWECLNITELGQVVDMIKDINKAMYYESIVEAMEKEGSYKHVKWMKDEEELDHTTMHSEKDHSN